MPKVKAHHCSDAIFTGILPLKCISVSTKIYRCIKINCHLQNKSNRYDFSTFYMHSFIIEFLNLN